MSKSIAYRRQQAARVKKAHGPHWLHNPSKTSIGIQVITPKPCRCWMCGNPRKWFGEHPSRNLICCTDSEPINGARCECAVCGLPFNR